MVKLRFRLANLLFFFDCFKVRWAYGVSSFTKDDRKLHWLLFDIDDKTRFAEVMRHYKQYNRYFYPTPNGYHVIVLKPCSLIEAARELLLYSDPVHVAIGLRRGYWFLETHRIVLNRKLCYMRIERNA